MMFAELFQATNRSHVTRRENSCRTGQCQKRRFLFFRNRDGFQDEVVFFRFWGIKKKPRQHWTTRGCDKEPAIYQYLPAACTCFSMVYYRKKLAPPQRFIFYIFFGSALARQALETVSCVSENEMNAAWFGFRNLFRNLVEQDYAHAPKLPKPSPDSCWTWPGSAPKPPETFSGTFFCTFSGTLLNLTSLCTKSPHHFSGTFLGTLSNLT